MSVCCECCVLSGRGLCDGLITRPEESYGCLSVVSVVCCQRFLRRAYHSSKGVLPTAVCRGVWSRNLVNEEAMFSWRGHEQAAYEDHARYTHTSSYNYEGWPWTLNTSIPRTLRQTSCQSLVFSAEKAIKFCVTQKPVKCCSSTVPFVLLWQWIQWPVLEFLVWDMHRHILVLCTVTETCCMHCHILVLYTVTETCCMH